MKPWIVLNYMRHKGRFPAVLGLLLLVSSMTTAWGQQKPPDFELDATPGFKNYVQEGHTSPVHVRIRNNTKNPLSGKLALANAAGDGPATTSIPVSIPQQSQRKYELLLWIPRGNRPQEITVSLLSAAGGTVISKRVPIRTAGYVDRLILGSSDEDLALTLPRAKSLQTYFISKVRTEDFPESWRTFSSVHLCVIGDQEFSKLTEKQVTALIHWVLQGGWLVVKAGRNSDTIARSSLARFLPVMIQGTDSIESYQSLSDFFGETIDYPGKMPVTRGELRSAEVLLKSDSGLPLIAQREAGRGRITAVLFDLDLQPVKDLSRRHTLWEELLRHDREVEPDSTVGDVFMSARNAFSVRIKPERFQPMPLSVILPYLMLYLLIVGPVDYWVLKWMRRQELTWLVFMATTLLFTATAFVWIYQKKKGSVQFDRFTVMFHYPHHGYMQGRVLANLYSQENRRYTVSAPPNSLLKRFSEERPADRGEIIDLLSRKEYDIEEGDTLLMKDVHVPIWTNEQFQMDTFSLEKVLELRLVLKDGEPHLSGANPYPFSIRGWVARPNLAPLKAVVPSKGRFDSLTLRVVKPDEFSRDLSDPRYRDIFAAFQNSLKNLKAVFIGMAEENPLNLSMVNLDPQSRDLAVFIVELNQE